MAQKITPFLWFDKNAEEAINYYASIFPGSKVVSIDRYPQDESISKHFKGMAGKVLTAVFELNGQQFMAIDGGPYFKFNEAISLLVECKDQEEIDYYWEKLSAVPESEQCGWCKDKFGLSWQIVPADMGQLIRGSKAATQAMLSMKKIDLAALQAAVNKK